MPKEITSITPEQEARFPEWREKWTAIGLSTAPADFETAERAALALYQSCDLPLPKIRLRLGSPYGACVGGVFALRLLDSKILDPLVAAGVSVEDAMPEGLKGKVGEATFRQVYAQLVAASAR